MNTAKLRGIIAERGFRSAMWRRASEFRKKSFYTKMKKGVFGTDEADRMIELLKIKNPAAIF